MRLSPASRAGGRACVDAAGGPAMAADSAISGICASVVGVVAAGFDRAHGGAASCPAEVAGAPASVVEPAIMAVAPFSSSRKCLGSLAPL
eukprot:4277434-Pyramimonas_sp.AAC.1